ncbi:Vegetative incompatibility protein [Lachnellula occidentalis]|uniref:Vegetative incompatibility protein n=1 Tax=Lachnellula occidentalis TaxID=215460 RepID=A0A8H8U8C2_9HELO|nr:Vegetative incompatibility protein [Lachnellula occidentalis]
MLNPTNTIGDAFHKLKRSISENDAHDWASTELKDVWVEVRKIDSEQRKRQSAQNLRRIEPLLNGIGKYAKVIEVLCNGTPFMPYVWAPIKLMLQLASQHKGIFEALLSAYSEIGAALPRFDRYERAFKDNLEFQNVLAAVYTNILEFHQRAYKFFRRRAWPLIFLSLWKDFQSRFEGIIDSLKSQRDFVDTEAASIDILEAKEFRTRVQYDIVQKQKHLAGLVEQNEGSARIAQLRHSIEWLAVDDKTQEDNILRISHRRHDETCQWVMKDPHMMAWIKNDSNHQVLWLNGKPGSGKSVMCSYITEVLPDTENIDVCYYFCSSQESGNVSTQILRTVILQLLRSHADIASLISNEFVYHGLSCGLTQLKALVPQILQLVPYTRILVDGIDECSKDTQKAVLKDLQAICLGTLIPCKVLFSSRKEVHISERLSGKQQISLDNCEEVETDIRLYVKHKATRLQTSDPELLGRIESILVDKANVMAELRYCFSDADLEKTATSLPKGLQKAYGRLLDRIINGSGRSDAIRILEWMACSYRPLKSYEILDGIAFQPGSTTLDEKTKMHKKVLDLCRPLIEDGPSNTLDFVHFSAKEYILQEDFHNGRPFISAEDAQHNISFSCVAYLNTNSCLLPKQSGIETRAFQVVRGLHSLQPYGNRFWTSHLLQYCSLQARKKMPLSEDLSTQLNMLTRFQKASETLAGPSKHQLTPVELEGLRALDQMPQVKTLVTSLIEFRSSLEEKDASNTSDKTPDDMSRNLCSSDPTHFSMIRYHYQMTLESLLSQQAPQLFPSIDKSLIKKFADLYGDSAFACHHPRCFRATDGFSSARQRDSHEASHARKFRCAHPSCVSFASGFVTRVAWSKHNDKYHRSVDEGPSLADCIYPDRQARVGVDISPGSITRDDVQTIEDLERYWEENRSVVPVNDVDRHSLLGTFWLSPSRKNKRQTNIDINTTTS